MDRIFKTDNKRLAKKKTILENVQDLLLVEGTKKSFLKDEYIFSQRERFNYLYFIIEGQVKSGYYTSTGEQKVNLIMYEGDVFGEEKLMGIDNMYDFAMASFKTDVYILPITKAFKMFSSYPDFNRYILSKVGEKQLDLNKRLRKLTNTTSRVRILEYLIDLTEKRGRRLGFEFLIQGFSRHKEIANITSTSRQTVTVLLNDLRRKDIIAFNRKRLIVRDLKGLRNQVEKL